MVTLFTKFTSLIWFYLNFVNNVTITLLDEETTKIKVIDIDGLYNFIEII